MEFAICHFSDIHFKIDERNAIEKRGELIAAAIDEQIVSLDEITIVISGDIAYSGKKEEFEKAYKFFMNIKDELNKRNHRVTYFSVPGNHDCDFKNIDEKERKEIIDKILVNKKDNDTDLKKLTLPQANFLSFQQKLNKEVDFDGVSFYFRKKFSNYSIVFLGYNTALFSQKKEIQGELLCKLLNIANCNDNDFIISSTHHPTNWLKAEYASELREEIEGTSDIVFTGHEHNEDLFKIVRADNNETLYISSGALQGNSESAFSVSVINIENQTILVNHLKWCQLEQQYVRINKNTKSVKPKNFIRNTDEFSSELDSIDSLITHPMVGKDLRLSHLYSYPALQAYDNREYSSSVVGANEVEKMILESDDNLLIMGKESSGKTSLAKTIYKDFYSNNNYCLLIAGEKLKKMKPDFVKNLIHDELEKQYDKRSKRKYLQFRKERRTLIIDDLDKTNLSPKATLKVLEEFEKYFGKIILIANKEFELILSSTNSWPIYRQLFATYSIKECSAVQTFNIVKNWHKLGQEENLTESELIDKCNYTIQRIDDLKRNKIISIYPETLLYILSIFDSDVIPDKKLKIETAYLLEFLIKININKISGPGDRSIHNTILSNFAHYVFLSGVFSFDISSFNSYVNEYNNNYGMNLIPYEIIKSYLNSNIFEKAKNDKYRFKSKIIYYYFTALHIKNNYYQCEEEITNITDDLSKEVNRNIFMILSTTIEEKSFSDILISKADKTIENHPEYEFSRRPTFPPFNIKKFSSIDDSDISKNVRELTSLKEALEYVDIDNEDSYDQTKNDELNNIIASFTLIRAIGLRLKSFVGSTKKENKLKLTKSCMNLGLRLLNWAISSFEKYYDEVVDQIEAFIKDSFKTTFDENIIRVFAENFVSFCCLSVSATIIDEISQSISSKSLMTVIKTINSDIPGYAIIIIRSQMLSNSFPEENIFKLLDKKKSNWLLEKILVLFTIYYFTFNYSPREVKQRVSSKLGLNFNTLLKHSKEFKNKKNSI